MALGTTNGSDNGYYSMITVTFVEGSTVTISPNAGKKNVSSTQLIYYIRQIGTYTITATLGEQETQTTVTIARIGKNVDVTLTYNVPVEYQAVEYLESTGTQYIIVSTGKGDITARMQYTELNHICGYGGGSTNILGIGAEGSNYYLRFGNGSAAQAGTCDTNVHDYSVTFSGNNGILYIDGTQKLTASGSFSGTSSYFALFAYIGNGRTNPASGYYNKMRIMHFKIEGQHDLYPCYRKSDSVAGLWDKETETFYTNNGSGTFTVGANI